MFKYIPIKEISDYQISETGIIKNPQGRLLKLTKTKEIRGKAYYTHRLVALVYLPKPSEKHTFVLFRDRNNFNPHVNNLYWATNEEYQVYKNRCIMKAVYQYTLDGTLIAVYKNCQEAGKNVFGRAHNIGRVCRKEDYTYLGYIWSYKELNKTKIDKHLKNKTPRNRYTAKRVAKIHPKTSKVIKVYPSMKDASLDNYINSTSISRAVKQKVKAGGYYYRLVDEKGNVIFCN